MIAVVERNESIVAPAARHIDVVHRAMRREQPAGLGIGGEIGVEAEHDVGLGRCAFELDAVEQRHAIGNRDELDIAAAFGLEFLLHHGTWTPVGGKALISVDGELVLGQGRPRQRKNHG